MLSFTSTVIVARRLLCCACFNGLSARASIPNGNQRRLWQTNGFQDGSHETHLVFKVVKFKEMFELRRFSHLLSPLLIWESEGVPPPPDLCPVLAAGPSAFTRLLEPIS
jgi:hypothetical protein